MDLSPEQGGADAPDPKQRLVAPETGGNTPAAPASRSDAQAPRESQLWSPSVDPGAPNAGSGTL